MYMDNPTAKLPHNKFISSILSLLPSCSCEGSLGLGCCDVLHCQDLANNEMSVGKWRPCLRKKRLEERVGQNETEEKVGEEIKRQIT